MAAVVYTKPINANRHGERPLIFEVPYLDLKWSTRLNKPGSISFTVPLDHPDIHPANIAPRRHEVEIVENGEVVWEGVLLTAKEDARTITFSGEGLLSRLREGRMALEFNTYLTKSEWRSQVLTPGGVAWELISRWQGTAGAGKDNPYVAEILASHNIDVGWGFTVDWTHYQRIHLVGGPGPLFPAAPDWKPTDFLTIYDAVEQLARGTDEHAVPFDYEIRPGRVFVPYWKKGRDRPDIIFDDRCVRSWSRDIDGTQQASGLLVKPRPEAEQTYPLVINTSAAAEYGLTVSEAQELDRDGVTKEQVKEELNHRRHPPTVLSITVAKDAGPRPGSYELGDRVRVVIPSKYQEIRATCRLIGMDFQRQDGEDRIVLHLDPFS